MMILLASFCQSMSSDMLSTISISPLMKCSEEQKSSLLHGNLTSMQSLFFNTILFISCEFIHFFI
ncbi:hypothetical protein NC653_009054 [Populus alba x Populus x berolinensis]|uniref:Uncharacterized protein n=1 Tax=Populus alba x Populus x berolinensis TaxID=444605 RepID=A0AAD6R873_9ROSI|nr:hypothetical protein NC653_009054 [Populus alba x Populus x berolinensis]